MLNLLNERLGLGVMYYSTDGINFPSLIEERSTGDFPSDFMEKHQKMLQVFDYYTNRSKPNDILLLSSRYELRWGEYPIPQSQRQLKFTYYDDKGSKIATKDALGKWENAFNTLIERALSKGLRVVIFNPIPTFQYPLPPSPQWFNKLAYARSSQQYFTRSELINHYQKVSDVLKSLQERHSNVFVFDAFGVLCPPPDSRQCLPDSYRDQVHLSTTGAEKMYPAFSSFLLNNFPGIDKP
ncbi:hypothetical protein H8F26_01470 [Synechococcus sp. CBW1006]|nr:hypothetical protein H8F26_01470 [Synechococcus sp. CBW1006]